MICSLPSGIFIAFLHGLINLLSADEADNLVCLRVMFDPSFFSVDFLSSV